MNFLTGPRVLGQREEMFLSAPCKPLSARTLRTLPPQNCLMVAVFVVQMFRALFSGILLSLVLVAFSGAVYAKSSRLQKAPTTRPSSNKTPSNTAKASSSRQTARKKKAAQGTIPSIVVRPAPDPKASALEPTGFATVLSVKKSAERLRDLSDILHQQAGLRVRSVGGLGSWSTLSIRGSSSAQVQILVDGIPLNHGSSAIVNLSDLPLEGLQRVEVYRGFVPASLGGAMGGAVNLVTSFAPNRPVLTASGSFGSWFSHRGMLSYAQRKGDWQWNLAASLKGTKGDFSYFDDKGTPFNFDDDNEQAIRANNDFELFSFLGRLRWKPGKHWAFNLTDLLTIREQGIPGLANFRSLKARYQHLRHLVQLSADARRLPVATMRWTQQLYLLHQHEFYTDPDGEIGLARQQQRNLAVAGGWKSRWLWFPTWNWEISLLSHLRGEGFSQQDELQPNNEPLQRQRIEWHPTFVTLVSFFEERLKVTASGTMQWLLQQVTQKEQTSQWLPTGRVGVQFAPTRWLSFKANGGRYVRVPTFWEMFGDRGTMVGNPALRPETGWLTDAGVVLQSRFRRSIPVRVQGVVTFFWTEAQDLIRFVQNSQRTMIAINIDHARTLGVEARLRLSLWKRLKVDADLTWLQATNLSKASFENGKQLPGRPLWETSTRLAWADRWGSVFVRHEFFAGMFLDVANLQELPFRHWWTFGASLSLSFLLRKLGLPFPFRGLRLLMEVKNLTDERKNPVPLRPPLPNLSTTFKAIADYSGYPLPGRAFFVTLSWKILPMTTLRSSQR